MAVLTVSQINRYMASKVSGDQNLRHFLIRGEISNFTAHSSGHFYFSLKDAESTVRAVMFRNMASQLRFRPENGMKVIASAGLTVYQPGGVYQLQVTDLQPEGVGTVQLQLEQRKKKLRAAGLFEQSAKRPLPALPHTVGIITSPTGAALQDMLNILRRRCPIVQVKIFPVLVQGEQAPASICRAIRFAGTQGCDVLILGRGGGSSEDLQAFNDEGVAYALYDCTVPVISAVGHETDVTIADAVADRRAPTPSAAAELAVPELSALHARTDIAARQLHHAYEAKLSSERQRLERLAGRLVICHPAHRIRLQEQTLLSLTERLQRSIRLQLERRTAAYTALSERLVQLDPLRVLKRGYAAVYRENGEVLSSVQGVQPGDLLRVRLSDGTLEAKVEKNDEL